MQSEPRLTSLPSLTATPEFMVPKLPELSVFPETVFQRQTPAAGEKRVCSQVPPASVIHTHRCRLILHTIRRYSQHNPSTDPHERPLNPRSAHSSSQTETPTAATAPHCSDPERERERESERDRDRERERERERQRETELLGASQLHGAAGRSVLRVCVCVWEETPSGPFQVVRLPSAGIWSVTSSSRPPPSC